MSHEQTSAQREPPDERAAGRPLAAVPSARPACTLVAEDNPLNGLLVEEQFRLLGYDVEIVTNGRAALARWRSGRFGALLTDIQMPEMDGYELARCIRDEERDGARIPIIALTANALHEGSTRWKSAGIDDYLVKPVELPNLKVTLERWLQRSAVDVAAPSALPAAQTGDEGQEPVDPRTLALMVGDDPAVLSHFLAGFARSANDAASGLSIAIEAGDRARVGSLAHQLKGTAGAVGALRLARLCADMEVAAREADDNALGASWRSFRPEVRRVESWISAHRADTLPKAEARPAP